MPGADADADADLAALQGVPGLDAARGLAAVGGRVAVYRRLLALFVEKHADDGRQIDRLLAGQRVAEAAALAHRLRGAAATLGLVEVETAVQALDDALDEALAAPPALRGTQENLAGVTGMAGVAGVAGVTDAALATPVLRALDELLPPLGHALAR